MSICVPTLAIAAVSGIEQAEQGLAAGLQGTLGQAGGGLGLAITTAVLAANMASGHVGATTTIPSVVAQLSGFHAGLLAAAAGAALGVLIAFFGLKIRSETP